MNRARRSPPAARAVATESRRRRPSGENCRASTLAPVPVEGVFAFTYRVASRGSPPTSGIAQTSATAPGVVVAPPFSTKAYSPCSAPRGYASIPPVGRALGSGVGDAVWLGLAVGDGAGAPPGEGDAATLRLGSASDDPRSTASRMTATAPANAPAIASGRRRRIVSDFLNPSPT